MMTKVLVIILLAILLTVVGFAVHFYYVVETSSLPRPPKPTWGSWSVAKREKLLEFLRTDPSYEEIKEYIGKEPKTVVPRTVQPTTGGGPSSHGTYEFLNLPADGSWVDHFFPLYKAKYYYGKVSEVGLTVAIETETGEMQWYLAPW